MTVKEKLEQYIKEDKIYQNFIDSKTRIKDLTDFDLYCINHCSDIEELLKENKELKKQLEVGEEQYNDLVKEKEELQEQLSSNTLQLEEYKDKINWYENFEVNKTIDKLRLKHNTQQKEFIKYLEDEIENSTFLKPSLKMILQKYKEIVNGDDK